MNENCPLKSDMKDFQTRKIEQFILHLLMPFDEKSSLQYLVTFVEQRSLYTQEYANAVNASLAYLARRWEKKANLETLPDRLSPVLTKSYKKAKKKKIVSEIINSYSNKLGTIESVIEAAQESKNKLVDAQEIGKHEHYETKIEALTCIIDVADKLKYPLREYQRQAQAYTSLLDLGIQVPLHLEYHSLLLIFEPMHSVKAP